MRFDVRTLGTVTLASSPLMLVECILAVTGHLPGGEFGPADAVFGLVYLCGFLAAIVALKKLQITGNRGWAAIFFYFQLCLLFMAAQRSSFRQSCPGCDFINAIW